MRFLSGCNGFSLRNGLRDRASRWMATRPGCIIYQPEWRFRRGWGLESRRAGGECDTLPSLYRTNGIVNATQRDGRTIADNGIAMEDCLSG